MVKFKHNKQFDLYNNSNIIYYIIIFETEKLRCEENDEELNVGI